MADSVDAGAMMPERRVTPEEVGPCVWRVEVLRGGDPPEGEGRTPGVVVRDIADGDGVRPRGSDTGDPGEVKMDVGTQGRGRWANDVEMEGDVLERCA